MRTSKSPTPRSAWEHISLEKRTLTPPRYLWSRGAPLAVHLFLVRSSLGVAMRLYRAGRTVRPAASSSENNRWSFEAVEEEHRAPRVSRAQPHTTVRLPQCRRASGEVRRPGLANTHLPCCRISIGRRPLTRRELRHQHETRRWASKQTIAIVSRGYVSNIHTQPKPS